MSRRFSRSFYTRDAESVARDLVGATLTHGGLSARIVETEAYVGTHDLACHASKGRTARTEVMFGPAGHAYVYLVYGMHELLNVVTGGVGDACAVLLRAAEPIALGGGLPQPPIRAPHPSTKPRYLAFAAHLRLMNGPGKLSRALGVTRELDGSSLCGGPIAIFPGTPPEKLVVTTRVGVDYAGTWKDAPLRFYDEASLAVSRRVRPLKPPSVG